MRISDWSSDVCSSDLPVQVAVQRLTDLRHQHDRAITRGLRATLHAQIRTQYAGHDIPVRRKGKLAGDMENAFVQHIGHIGGDRRRGARQLDPQRSEEHTSELQSLMRISYAVC